MVPAAVDGERSGRRWPQRALARESVRYALAVIGYIALILLTKEYLTFTWGVFYFVMVLEVLPRLVRWIRRRWRAQRSGSMSELTES